ncbi:hypothetical protein A5886_002219 [Enterococcus sp. 8G7_MSG3316]|uniref:Mid-cell-anchored protein Z n=1 Tax=Candidatus Enterococcus testudinis TaxID=1834191 RepID=A0A242A889_9ENTE|nr:cell division site-positioning protein MapZ family protein [Enterococcus sp. 8G7_MSG3316]OTN77139.1 hypothetical protein A5886_002219 [Enterococcus sp. 8G7_MSG3316]
MEKICPNCGFQASEITPVCPNCGCKWAEIEDTSTDALTGDQPLGNENDDIRWSDYKHVSIGEMEEQFGESHRDPNEKNKTTTRVTGFQSKEDVSEEDAGTPLFARKQTEEDTSETSETSETTEAQTEAEQLAAHDAEILSAYIRRHKGEEDLDSMDAEPADQQADIAEDAKSAVKDEPEESDQATSTKAASTLPTEAPTAEPVAPVTDTRDSQATDTATAPKKKSKKIVYLAAAVCLIAAGGGWVYYQQQQTAAQEAQIAQDTADLDQIEQALNAMYSDQDHVYLNSDVTAESVEALQQQLTAFKDNDRYQDLATEADTIADKIAALKEINGYFAEPAVVEDQLNQVSLKEAAAISMAKRDEKDGFDTLVNQAITMGQTEYQEIQEVQNAVKSMTALIKDGEAPDSITRSNYNELMKKVQALPIESEVTTLSDSLKTVDTSLTKRETAEKAAAEKAAAEKAAAEKAAAEAAASAQAAQSASSSTTQNASEDEYVLSPNTPTNTNNQPIIPARQSDLADTTNSAWNWADGVKEKIIATAIARGYVVEGGYTFERVRIVDGEGYYNFYATNAEGSLLKGTGDSALPMYLFTVNAKTGYFRGNGNDHTVR